METTWANLSEIVQCPACGSLFTNQRIVDTATDKVDYLDCSNCRAKYPVERGVPYFYCWDEYMADLLPLILYDYCLYRRTKEGRLEDDLMERSNQARQHRSEFLQDCLKKVLTRVNFVGQPLMLVLGARSGEIASLLQERGATVVAVEFEPFELLSPNFNYFLTNTDRSGQLSSTTRRWRPVLAQPHRLPFIPNCFDVIFCPPFFHRVPQPRMIINELYRVLAPGGRLILLCQPCASISPGRAPSQENFIAHYLGSPATIPTFCQYFWELRYTGFRQLFWEELFPSSRVKKRLITFPFLIRHLFHSGLITVLAAKPYRAKKRQTVKMSRLAAEIKDIADLMRNFEQQVQKAHEIVREAKSHQGLCSFIDLGKKLSYHQGFGWRDIETIAGEQARYPLKDAFCYLVPSGKAETLEIYLLGVPRRFIKKYQLQIFVNGQELGPIGPVVPGWQTLRLDLSSVKKKDILEIHIQQDNLFSLYEAYGIEDPREIGIAVKYIKEGTA